MDGCAMMERFETMLTGGHPNSLGSTIEVVEITLVSPDRFEELFNCYRSEDAIVRLRTSNAMRRVEAERHDLLVHYIDRFIHEIGALDQPSAQWTLAVLFRLLERDMTEHQRTKALAVMKRNLAEHDDWIVLNNSIETLTLWALDDGVLADWLRPHLERLKADPRKSVAARARKFAAKLG
ncbi:MAG: hypothetical protein AAFY73_05170 [Pseudomonadota bacterium]